MPTAQPITIELMPKTPFITDYSQGADGAVDLGSHRHGALWVTAEGLVGTDTVDVTLETANINDEAAFVSSGTAVTLGASAMTPATALVALVGVGRFARLAITFNAATANAYANIHAVLHLQRD